MNQREYFLNELIDINELFVLEKNYYQKGDIDDGIHFAKEISSETDTGLYRCIFLSETNIEENITADFIETFLYKDFYIHICKNIFENEYQEELRGIKIDIDELVLGVGF